MTVERALLQTYASTPITLIVNGLVQTCTAYTAWRYYPDYEVLLYSKRDKTIILEVVKNDKGSSDQTSGTI